MPIGTGSILGPYKITALIGTGGMGEVYKAHDSRLDRVVAVKTLQTRAKAPEELRQRFEVEARAVARLQHPNICALYDVGETGGVPYLVMEYLEGKPLSERIAEGAVPVSEALRIAAGIAAGLDAAHRAGITHRDLKPGNVVLTKTGAKLLDFGLARVMERGAAHDATTMSAPITSEGTLLGTVPYMAPEQVEGKPADARTDIFALGLILYEMLTGRRAFQGETQARLMAAILREEPAALGMSPGLDRCVARCLAKDPDDRWQTARDLARELEWLAAGNTQSGAQAIAVPEPRRRWLPWAALAATLVIGATAWTAWRPAPAPSSPFIRVLLNMPPGTGTVIGPILSPDGLRALLYFADAPESSNPMIYSVATGRFEPSSALQGINGAAAWSPNGESIVYYAGQELRRVDLATGRLQVLTNQGYSRSPLAWSGDGYIYFSDPGGNVRRIRETGGETELYTPAIEGGIGVWQALPRASHLLVLTRRTGAAQFAAHLVEGKGQPPRHLVDTDSGAFFSAGYLIYQVGPRLVARTFDPRDYRLGEEVSQVHNEVDNYFGRGPSASLNGHVILRRRNPGAQAQLAWFDRVGKELSQIGGPAVMNGTTLSPDGTKVAVSVGEILADRDVWVFDLARDLKYRLTPDPRDDSGPYWSPDGKYIAYRAARGGRRDIFRRLASGAGEEEQLLDTPQSEETVLGWPGDGSWIYFAQNGNLHRLEVATKKTDPKAVVAGQRISGAALSPDGRWVVYRAGQSGAGGLVLQSVESRELRTPVAPAGAGDACWRQDGRELFYGIGTAIMAMDVNLSTNPPTLGRPRKLFDRQLVPGEFRNKFDVSPDGSRFLIMKPVDNPNFPDLELLINWPRLLQK